MDTLLAALRAIAEPTRLRLLALAARGSFCVTDFTDILGQSQPRLSRHLRLLHEAGLLERVREGANVWFTLPDDETGRLARDLVARAPENDPHLMADRRQAARVLAERARAATALFQRQGAHWDEAHALDLPVEAVRAALVALLPSGRLGRLLDIGTGTGTLLETLGPRVEAGLGVDASRAMLALARSRLSRPELAHCSVRQADMYRLPLTDSSFDVAVMQMVLHYAEDPRAALAEAARVLRPGGTLIVVDLLPHGDRALADRLAHRWPGFADADLHELVRAAGLHPDAARTVDGPLPVRIWSARPAQAPSPSITPLSAVPAHAGAAPLPG